MNEIIILSSSLDTYQSSASGLFLTRFTEGKVVGNHLINRGKMRKIRGKQLTWNANCVLGIIILCGFLILTHLISK